MEFRVKPFAKSWKSDNFMGSMQKSPILLSQYWRNLYFDAHIHNRHFKID